MKRDLEIYGPPAAAIVAGLAGIWAGSQVPLVSAAGVVFVAFAVGAALFTERQVEAEDPFDQRHGETRERMAGIAEAVGFAGGAGVALAALVTAASPFAVGAFVVVAVCAWLAGSLESLRRELKHH